MSMAHSSYDLLPVGYLLRTEIFQHWRFCAEKIVTDQPIGIDKKPD